MGTREDDEWIPIYPYSYLCILTLAIDRRFGLLKGALFTGIGSETAIRREGQAITQHPKKKKDEKTKRKFICDNTGLQKTN
jgi:hypothetical protein